MLHIGDAEMGETLTCMRLNVVAVRANDETALVTKTAANEELRVPCRAHCACQGALKGSACHLERIAPARTQGALQRSACHLQLTVPARIQGALRGSACRLERIAPA